MVTSRPEPAADGDRLPDRPPRIRVLWLVKGLGPGGAERLLTLTTRHRDRDLVVPRVSYLLPHKVALRPEIEAEGVPVTCLGRRWSGDPRWLGTLRRSLRSDPVDVVHAHSPVTAIGARLVVRSLPRRLRPCMVTTDHSLWNGHRRASRWADSITCVLDDAHLAVSDAVQASLPARLRARSEVVLHGVDVAQVRRDGSDREEVRAELGIHAGALVVGTVANLRLIKAYPDLLAAAKQVLEQMPDVRFVAVGQGPREAAIRAIHARLGLGDRFQLLGHRPDAVRVLGACDVFCLASHHEGLPVALMEALVLGLPVVATAVGGVTEVVDDRREGLLVPPGRPEQLATALLKMLTDTAGREAMASAAASRGETLSIEAAVRRTEAVYASLVDG